MVLQMTWITEVEKNLNLGINKTIVFSIYIKAEKNANTREMHQQIN